jgi:hypothetical protein
LYRREGRRGERKKSGAVWRSKEEKRSEWRKRRKKVGPDWTVVVSETTNE